MECPVCHLANPESHRFCGGCGSALSLRCAACGFEIAPGDRFCGGCGTALAGATALPPAPPAKRAAPSWGELKQATILFADIVSSTEQIASLGPEEAMERLQPALTAMCDSVRKFGGTVVRTMGDGIMALFGVPLALEGHAMLACEAALHMQESFKDNPHRFAIRVGLHSGLVASDPASLDATRERGAHGVAIHLASRVVGLAMPSTVCITQDCLALVRIAARVQSIGRHVLKGIAQPVEVFTLLSLNTTAADLHFHQAALSPFLGRDAELSQLQAAFESTESGDTCIVGISGAPGTGKSRLCFEFARRCRARSVPVFEVRAQLYGHATPLQPALELMRTCFFGIAAGDSPAEVRRRVTQILVAVPGCTPDDEMLLFEFLGVLPPEQTACALDSKSRHARLLQLTRGLVRQRPLPSVILFEDLHWMDDASAEFLDAIAGAVSGTRTLLVLNYRPSYKAHWGNLPNFMEIGLGELSSEDTFELVHKLVSHRRELQEVCKLIAQRSAGNPFFAEELVRAVAESGILGAPSAENPAPNVIEHAMPATVQAVLGERIDRLDAEEKALLQLCAVIGKDVPAGVVHQVEGGEAEGVDRYFDSLCRAELLQPMVVMGEQGYAFRHPLIQEVAYSTQLKSRRASLHARVALALTRWCGDSLDEHAALIAHHYQASGQNVDAAVFEARAARWIQARDSGQAVKHWFRVRDLLQGQPRTAQVDSLRVMLGSHMGNLAWREGIPHHEVLPLLDDAIEHATAVDARVVQLLHIGRGRMHWGNGGTADDYVNHVRQAMALVDADDIGRAAALNAFLCQALAWAGLFKEALKANDAALAAAHAIERGDHEYIGFNVEHWLLGLRLRLLTRLGRFGEIAEISTSLQGVLAGTQDAVIKMIVHYMFVEVGCFSKDRLLAARHSLHLKELAQTHQSPYLNAYSQSCAGLGEMAAGNHEGASAHFMAAISIIREARVAPELESEVLSHHSLCLLRTGSLRSAIHVADEAVVVAQRRANRFSECLALMVAGRAILAEDKQTGASLARAHLSRAARLLEHTGAHVLDGLFADDPTPLGGTPAAGGSVSYDARAA
jgi:class 3 adenylate cyclase